ncbi:hypothetical protein LguiB_015675 [Lonicera macranthoides]
MLSNLLTCHILNIYPFSHFNHILEYLQIDMPRMRAHTHPKATVPCNLFSISMDCTTHAILIVQVGYNNINIKP